MNLALNSAVLPFLKPLVLKPLGLEPGRALANAQPNAEQLRDRRIEQFRYIVAQCAAANEVTADPRSIERRMASR